MTRQRPKSKRTDTLLPSPTLVRSLSFGAAEEGRPPSTDLSVAQDGPSTSSGHTDHIKRTMLRRPSRAPARQPTGRGGSDEHPSDLPSLMRLSYAVFGLQHPLTADFPPPLHLLQRLHLTGHQH